MHISFFNKFVKILVDLIFIAFILIRSQLTHTYPRFTQRFFIRRSTSIALRTSKTSQYDSSHNIDFFFHIGACPFSSFEICWLPRPFPNTTWTSFIIEKTRFPSRNIGSARVFGSLEIFPFPSEGVLQGKKSTMAHIHDLPIIFQIKAIGFI